MWHVGSSLCHVPTFLLVHGLSSLFVHKFQSAVTVVMMCGHHCSTAYRNLVSEPKIEPMSPVLIPWFYEDLQDMLELTPRKITFSP